MLLVLSKSTNNVLAKEWTILTILKFVIFERYPIVGYWRSYKNAIVSIYMHIMDYRYINTYNLSFICTFIRIAKSFVVIHIMLCG
jgi:hypothetical protein